MKEFKIILFLLSVILLGSSCGVSSFKAQNWIQNDPNDLSKELYRTNNLERCRQQAQINDIEAGDNNANATIPKHNNYDKSIMNSCMQAHGYTLRDLTDSEVFLNTISAPIVFPLTVLGKDFENIY